MQGWSEMQCKMLGRVKVLMSGLDLTCVLRKEKNEPGPSHSELDESIFHSFQPSFSSFFLYHIYDPESLSVRLYIYIFSYHEYP